MKKTRYQIRAIVAIIALLPAIAWAHPGHGSGGFWPGFLHPFLGLDHLLAMIAVGVWAAQIGGRALWAVPLAFVVAMAVGGILGYAGVTMPMAEPLVAASVLLLGLVVAMRARLPVAAGALLVAAFAPFHGAAHAAEMPAMVSFVSYAVGFALSTAGLHASGILAALAARSQPAIVRAAAGLAALTGAWLLVSRLQ